MEIFKELSHEMYESARRYKMRTLGGITFAGIITLGVIDHNCNPKGEEYVKESEQGTDVIEMNDTGMIPLENGLTAEIA